MHIIYTVGEVYRVEITSNIHNFVCFSSPENRVQGKRHWCLGPLRGVWTNQKKPNIRPEKSFQDWSPAFVPGPFLLYFVFLFCLLGYGLPIKNKSAVTPFRKVGKPCPSQDPKQQGSSHQIAIPWYDIQCILGTSLFLSPPSGFGLTDARYFRMIFLRSTPYCHFLAMVFTELLSIFLNISMVNPIGESIATVINRSVLIYHLPLWMCLCWVDQSQCGLGGDSNSQLVESSALVASNQLFFIVSTSDRGGINISSVCSGTGLVTTGVVRTSSDMIMGRALN